MREYLDPDGSPRIWFEADEVESLIEDELDKSGLLPSMSQPVTRLELFIEGHLGATLDQYADLNDQILGATEFRHAAAPRVLINRKLTEVIDSGNTAIGLHGRWRATLAHEAAHVLLHQRLFQGHSEAEGLFPGPPIPEGAELFMRCLSRNVMGSPMASDWREVQANMGMAALLMPRTFFKQTVEHELKSLGESPDSIKTNSPEFEGVITRLSGLLMVSKAAVKIRLGTLGLVLLPGESTIWG